MSTISSFIADYTSSEHFMLLDARVKEHAESLLDEFCRSAGEPHSIADAESALHRMARLELPLQVRRDIPLLISSFYEYVGSTGRDPRALQWAADIALLAKEYGALFRDDGSVRGTTFEKKYSATGRNDPCPCGSGKKFKKCCG